MSRFLEGNAITLLENGTEFFPALHQAIDGAQKEIFFETYIFENDETGKAIAWALRRAALRGVAVRLLVDGFGGRQFVRSLMPEMIPDGVGVMIYRRELRAFSLRRHRLRRMHRKLVVVDGAVAFVGGINIVDDLQSGALPLPRYDYAVRVEGPLLGPILASVHRLWRLVTWARLQQRLREPPIAPAKVARAGTVRAAFVTRDSFHRRHEIENAYLDAIGKAQREIVIACAYFFPGRRFRQALVDAARRGVEVTLLLQGISDHPMLTYATRALYPFFLGRGVRLYEYHQSELHAKVAVVDKIWATVGSSNIDPFSLLLAREANIVVVDAGFATRLRESLRRGISNGARELRREDWHRLPAIRRAASWLAYQTVRLAIGMAGYGGKH